jgi:multiple antibiotic resistance protein
MPAFVPDDGSMIFANFWIDFVTLLVTINPICVIPLYLALTNGLSSAARTSALRRAALVSMAILLIFLIVGEIALSALGVTLNAFRVAGGLVLLLIGLRMVFDEGLWMNPTRDNDTTGRDIAVFPLAMPLIAGPGAIMVIVLLTENNLHSIPQQAGTAITMCLVVAITYAILRAAESIHRLLGSTGTSVVARVTGLVVTALAVQTMIVGFQNLFSASL